MNVWIFLFDSQNTNGFHDPSVKSVFILVNGIVLDKLKKIMKKVNELQVWKVLKKQNTLKK